MACSAVSKPIAGFDNALGDAHSHTAAPTRQKGGRLGKKKAFSEEEGHRLRLTPSLTLPVALM
jgi:hypothetical protein